MSDELFPHLNRKVLENLASGWGQEFPDVSKISIHSYLHSKTYRYAVIFYLDLTPPEKGPDGYVIGDENPLPDPHVIVHEKPLTYEERLEWAGELKIVGLPDRFVPVENPDGAVIEDIAFREFCKDASFRDVCRYGRSDINEDEWFFYPLYEGEPLPDFVSELCWQLYPIEGGNEEGNQSKEAPVSQYPQQAENFFIQNGATWKVGFRGQQAQVKDVKGIRYIAMLLEKNGIPVSVTAMPYPVEVRDAEESTTEKQAFSDGLTTTGKIKGTNEAKILREKRRDLEEQLRSGTLGLEDREEIQEQVEVITHAINKSERETSTQASLIQRQQSAVYHAMKRAYDTISSSSAGKLKDLVEHLRDNIGSGGNYTYRYSGDLTWEVSW